MASPRCVAQQMKHVCRLQASALNSWQQVCAWHYFGQFCFVVCFDLVCEEVAASGVAVSVMMQTEGYPYSAECHLVGKYDFKELPQ